MKKSRFLAVAAAVAATAFTLQAKQGISIIKTDGETLQIANADLASMTFDGTQAVFTSTEGAVLSIERGDISFVNPLAEVAAAYTVTFNGAEAVVVNPYPFYGVRTSIDGAYVTVDNPDVATELTFNLSGATTDGGFTYNGAYKCTLQLSGIDLTSQRGAAIDIQCGKRIAVEVTGDNNLADCPGGTQKACLYFRGHPEFTGAGTLTVTGNTNHGISSKEYIQLKKSFGTLTIAGSQNDGIHAGQYFQINGGSVTVRNVPGDGIQAEATSTETDENNGQMIIKGGNIDISITGDESDCLKADSLITISGGTILLQSSGATSKGIKSKSDIIISGGEITATMTGNGIVNQTTTTQAPVLRGPGGGGPGGWGPGGGNQGWDQEDVDTSAPGCIKADGDLTITGGTFNLKATGKGGKCINVEGKAVIGEDGTDGPVIIASTSGAAVTGSGENLSGMPKAIKVYGNLDINSGTITATTTQNGGEGIECKSYLTINGGVVSCATYDDGINAGAKITVNGGFVYTSASNNDGMDCNGSGGFEFNGGIILASGTNSPEEGFDCDNYSFVINGGYIIGTGGATSSVTKATQAYTQASSQSITANQYLSVQKSDGTVICSYKVPKSLNATVVVSVPEFVSGTQYKLVRNSTAVNNPTASYLDGRFTLGGTLTGGTSSTITPRTK